MSLKLETVDLLHKANLSSFISHHCHFEIDENGKKLNFVLRLPYEDDMGQNLTLVTDPVRESFSHFGVHVGRDESTSFVMADDLTRLAKAGVKFSVFPEINAEIYVVLGVEPKRGFTGRST